MPKFNSIETKVPVVFKGILLDVTVRTGPYGHGGGWEGDDLVTEAWISSDQAISSEMLYCYYTRDPNRARRNHNKIVDQFQQNNYKLEVSQVKITIPGVKGGMKNR